VETSAPCDVAILGRTESTFAVAGHHDALVLGHHDALARDALARLDDLEPGAQIPYVRARRLRRHGFVFGARDGCHAPADRTWPGPAQTAGALRWRPARVAVADELSARLPERLGSAALVGSSPAADAGRHRARDHVAALRRRARSPRPQHPERA
jgi:hypothetical protein